MELLRHWRRTYGQRQRSMPRENGPCVRSAKDYPYDTSPEYMSLLTREDIEKDLPDKYKKRLWRRCKPSVPRKNNSDVHLAMKIKQLFENLEAIDLNRGEMTPRTEQKVLLTEIHKTIRAVKVDRRAKEAGNVAVGESGGREMWRVSELEGGK
ncbi:unnamed protein product, partial [Iphiclides podalirius]